MCRQYPLSATRRPESSRLPRGAARARGCCSDYASRTEPSVGPVLKRRGFGGNCGRGRSDQQD
ncbi:hypothetical protein DV515_00014881 [Chloebia gouldiae]|uniref:Uncharacterized protein n=1 Tax=Chloebia gouldiae TaxID=44316 RepID=A0A3L8RX67_CHLGU|nr:hypothetical protein DV515_00014881 [Chloebia gouldiae]